MRLKTRTPEQIDAVLAAVREAWLAVPKWRLGQLISNATAADPFYFRDDAMVDEMRKIAAVHGKRKPCE